MRTETLQTLLDGSDSRAVFFAAPGGSSLAPFPGVFPESLLHQIKSALKRGEHSPRRFLSQVECHWLPLEESILPSLSSFNSLAELQGAGLR